MTDSARFWRLEGKDVILSVRLTPRSAKDAIGGLWKDEKGVGWLQAQVRAVPEKGQANKALIRLVAKTLRLPAKHIVLESGDTSRLKRLRLVARAHEIDDIASGLDGS